MSVHKCQPSGNIHYEYSLCYLADHNVNVQVVTGTSCMIEQIFTLHKSCYAV